MALPHLRPSLLPPFRARFNLLFNRRRFLANSAKLLLRPLANAVVRLARALFMLVKLLRRVLAKFLPFLAKRLKLRLRPLANFAPRFVRLLHHVLFGIIRYPKRRNRPNQQPHNNLAAITLIQFRQTCPHMYFST